VDHINTSSWQEATAMDEMDFSVNPDPVSLVSLVKVCPACNEKNPVSEVICRVCMTNLTSVSPTREGETPKPGGEPEGGASAAGPEGGAGNGDRTVCAPPSLAVLTLSRASDGRSLPVPDGGVLGRGGDGGAFFERDMTVSRRHAKVGLSGGVWVIEDLNSTNGTWVNGKRLEAGRPCPINVGDSVALSAACELKVIA
jgi:hypothetical protein